jgi:hypothetical protein
MQRDAQAIGKRLIAEERALDGAFRGGRINEADVGERVKKLATMQGHLREVHLRAPRDEGAAHGRADRAL